MWAQAERRQAERLRTGPARQDGAPGDRPKEEGPRPPAARPVRSPRPQAARSPCLSLAVPAPQPSPRSRGTEALES